MFIDESIRDCKGNTKFYLPKKIEAKKRLFSFLVEKVIEKVEKVKKVKITPILYSLESLDNTSDS